VRAVTDQQVGALVADQRVVAVRALLGDQVDAVGQYGIVELTA